MITNLRKQRATWNVVERESKDGDRVIVDFDGRIKDEPFPGGQGTEVPVVLGQGAMLPDFEKALFGVSAGDEKTFKVKFPKDYHAEDLQGKKVDFSIKVHKVEEEELPPLDDSLAELYGVSEGGLDQLRSDVTQNMRRGSRPENRGGHQGAGPRRLAGCQSDRGTEFSKEPGSAFHAARGNAAYGHRGP